MANELNEIKELSLEPVKREAFAPWAIFMLIAILPFLSMVAYLFTNSITENQQKHFDARFMERIELVSENKSLAIDLWLEESVLIAKRITNSRIIQMFSADINESGLNTGISGPLANRLLYINEVLSTFATQNKLVGAHLINRRSKEYAISHNSNELTENYNEFARKVLTTKKVQYSPLRVDGERMLMDVYLPIYTLKISAEALVDKTDKPKSRSTKRVAGVLAITMSVKEKLKNIMKQSLNKLGGENIYIFQTVSGGAAILRLEKKYEGIFTQDKDLDSLSHYKRVWSIFYLRKEGKFDLSKIPKFGSQSNILPRVGEILMVKSKTKNLPLVIMTVLDLRDTYADFVTQRRQLQIIGQLLALMIFILFLSFWWRHQEARQRLLTEQYQGFAGKVNAQRHLLLSINSAVEEHISLKYFDGKYVYVNQAFADFFNLEVSEIIGHNDTHLYGSKVAEYLALMDKELLKIKKAIFKEENVIIQDKRHYLEIAKAPFLDGDRKFIGIITVIRDVTEIVQGRQLRERAMKNSMRCMMRIMERHDLHLVKHAKYLRNFVSDIAEKLNLTQEDKMTLEIASNLSQIGKIYLSKDILLSEGELNDQDKVSYRAHIEDTAYILDTVDWGLPIVKTVYGMHENLDGTGYPNTLTSPDISKLSRILGVCDTFCKLVAPRRGYKVFTPEEAIKFMVNEKGKYDLSVIQVLAELLNEDGSIILAS